MSLLLLHYISPQNSFSNSFTVIQNLHSFSFFSSLRDFFFSPTYSIVIIMSSNKYSRFIANQPSLNEEELEELLASPHQEKGEKSSCNPISWCATVWLCPFTFFANFFSVEQNAEAVIMRFGKYEKTVKDPGCYCSPFCGRRIITISHKLQSVDLPKTQQRVVIDAEGNPLIVSAVATFQMVNSYRAALDVSQPQNFLVTQGETVLKNVIAAYPYEASDNIPSLRTHSTSVSNELKRQLQERVKPAGILVHGFDLKEITYAPVIANAMLKRQQAQAIISARQAIVTGAVDISTHALKNLQASGIEFSQQESTRLVSNLLTVLCAETDVQPTLPMQ
eukprot:m.15845 g.15845  ORF g.15845 m.15845 type:complete len:335 (+) comp4531_c0_seq1:33-1037(+)